jgi:glutamyl-tRNA reductase
MSDTELLLVGTSHHHSPVEVRERLAMGPGHGGELLARLTGSGAEAVALSTCNRCCLYLAGEDVDAARAAAVSQLAAISGAAEHELEPFLFTKGGEEVARHLFRVAAGLDSLVPGEAQILGQVREAYERAERAGAVGPVLDHVFRQALHVGKRVRAETGIGENPASVSSAAAGLAARVFGDLRRSRVLLVGAGKMGELAAANLVGRGVGSLVVVNRSPERAAALVERYGGRAERLEALPAELAAADVVISSTGAEGLVVTAPMVAEALRGRRGRPMFFIDIAVPRDLDPAIHELDGAYLYDLDDLEAVVEQSIATRRGEAARAEAIVEEELERFRAWWVSRDVVPAIVALRARAEEIRRAELARLEGRLGALDARQRHAVDALTSQLVAKLLHLPTVRLKEAAATPAGASYAAAVRELFGLRDGELS